MQRKESKKLPPSGFVELEYPLHDKLETILYLQQDQEEREVRVIETNLLNFSESQLNGLHVPDDLNQLQWWVMKPVKLVLTRGLVDPPNQEIRIQGFQGNGCISCRF